MTSDRQLFVEVTGINVAGSTLWQASVIDVVCNYEVSKTKVATTRDE
jgi:hypothetical protein